MCVPQVETAAILPPKQVKQDLEPFPHIPHREVFVSQQSVLPFSIQQPAQSVPSQMLPLPVVATTPFPFTKETLTVTSCGVIY
jgi:hypothetical protein